MFKSAAAFGRITMFYSGGVYTLTGSTTRGVLHDPGGMFHSSGTVTIDISSGQIRIRGNFQG